MEDEPKPEEPAVTPPETSESAATEMSASPPESPEAPRAASPPAPLEEAQAPPAPEPAPQEPEPRLETPAPPPLARSQDFREVIRQAKVRKHEARLEKLLAHVRERGRISNDEIQKLLRVSDATASRYAVELVRRGALRKAGSGRAAYYQI